MFKVMTYNIQHGIDYIHRLSTGDVRIDLLKIASIIKDTNASIISLNEVYDAILEQHKELKSYEDITDEIFYDYVSDKSSNEEHTFIYDGEKESVRSIYYLD